jgi:hypothetical protein
LSAPIFRGSKSSGFAAYWRWISRLRGGRPRIGKEMSDLIRTMSIENPLWGAPKIHGGLLKLGIDVAQSIVECCKRLGALREIFGLNPDS